MYSRFQLTFTIMVNLKAGQISISQHMVSKLKPSVFPRHPRQVKLWEKSQIHKYAVTYLTATAIVIMVVTALFALPVTTRSMGLVYQVMAAAVYAKNLWADN